MPELRKKLGLTIALMTARSDAEAAAIIQQTGKERPPKTTPMSAEEKQTGAYDPLHEQELTRVVGKSAPKTRKTSTATKARVVKRRVFTSFSSAKTSSVAAMKPAGPTAAFLVASS